MNGPISQSLTAFLQALADKGLRLESLHIVSWTDCSGLDGAAYAPVMKLELTQVPVFKVVNGGDL